MGVAGTDASEDRFELVGSGRAAEVLSWAPGVVVKLVREPRFEDGLRREAASLEAAAAAGVPVPRPLGFVSHESRLGLLLERVDGSDLFSLIHARPWRAWSLARLVGRLHVTVAAASGPAGTVGLKQHAEAVIAGSPAIPARARGRLLKVLAEATDGDRLCHMDFHPGNVMLAGNAAHIIDFPNARRGPAIADHARTWVVLRYGVPPERRRWLARMWIAALRRLAVQGYVSGYRSATAVDEVELARWKAIQVAIRLDEGIAAERVPLLRLLGHTLRRAEIYSAPAEP